VKAPATPPLPLSDGSRIPDAVRVQILATEHWSLLATRTMSWNEAFSRATMFLTVLSAAVVALALAAQATGFGPDFRLFALVVLPVVLLVGLGTFSRLGHINQEDFWLVAGMNRLRHAYLELAPELEPYFVTGHDDDLTGIALTYTPSASRFGLNPVLSSTPYVVGAINALVAGIFLALAAQAVGAQLAASIVAGGVGGALLLAALLGPAVRRMRVQERIYHPRFPANKDGQRPE
jgi:hypothetical protein